MLRKMFSATKFQFCLNINQSESRYTPDYKFCLFARHFSKQELREMIPDLSKWQIDRARRHAAKEGPGHQVVQMWLSQTNSKAKWCLTCPTQWRQSTIGKLIFFDPLIKNKRSKTFLGHWLTTAFWSWWTGPWSTFRKDTENKWATFMVNGERVGMSFVLFSGLVVKVTR